MNRRLLASLALALAAGATSAARADLGPLEPLADLHRAVHESLGLPEPLVVRLLERGLPDVELPVVGLVAAQLTVTPERVVDLRLAGRSWIDLTVELGGGPEIFYVPFARDPGPPYGKAWGHYKKTPREKWRAIRLTDAEVIDLANVHLCARQYALTPDRVVQLRRGGESYAQLHRELRGRRADGKGTDDAPGKGKSKSKSKAKPKEKPPR